MSLFEDYFAYVQGTEPPLFMHRWCLISGVGALLARNLYFPFGHSNIYPNNYVMLIGSPGTRKSTAINIIKNLMRDAGYEHFAGNKSSKEKFLEDLAGIDTFDEGIPAHKGDINTTIINLFGEDMSMVHEMFVAVDEFTNFVGTGNYEFISLLGELWDNLPSYKARVKNSRSPLISQPTVSLLSGNTSAGFAAAFPTEMIGQGFMSRLLLIHGERTDEKITWPRTPTADETTKMIAKLVLIREQVAGEAVFTQEARDAVDRIYKSWPDLDDIRFKHYSTRRLTHLLKLCMVCAAMRLSTEMNIEDVVLANTILTYSEHLMPKAMGEFGKSRHSAQNEMLLQYLADAGKALTLKEVFKLMATNVDNMRQLAEMIQGLVQADKIQVVGNAYLIKQRAMEYERPFVDYNLLPEAEGVPL